MIPIHPSIPATAPPRWQMSPDRPHPLPEPINISPYPIPICVVGCGQWQYVPGAGTQQFYTFAHSHYYLLLLFTYYHIMLIIFFIITSKLFWRFLQENTLRSFINFVKSLKNSNMCLEDDFQNILCVNSVLIFSCKQKKEG